jgi:hypothetical protein
MNPPPHQWQVCPMATKDWKIEMCRRVS